MTDKAMGNLDYDRVDNDFYATPPWMVQNILPTLIPLRLATRGTKFVEPACGDGAISKVLRMHGFDCVSSDLADRGYGTPGKDFLQSTVADMQGGTFIFTNPPFGKLAEQFVRRALSLTSKVKNGRVGMILRNEWDCGKGRMDLFQNHPAYALKIVYTTRPRWIANTTGSPRHNYAAFFWDWNNKDLPKIRYINKNQ